MKLLVLNIGSTSFRFSIFDTKQLNLLISGKMENLGTQDGYCIYEKILTILNLHLKKLLV